MSIYVCHDNITKKRTKKRREVPDHVPKAPVAPYPNGISPSLRLRSGNQRSERRKRDTKKKKVSDPSLCPSWITKRRQIISQQISED